MTSTEEISSVVYNLDVKDDVNVNTKATFERLVSPSFGVKAMQAYSLVDCLFT